MGKMATFAELASGLLQLATSYQDVGAWSIVVNFCATRSEIPAVLAAMYLTTVYGTREKIPEHPYTAIVDRCFALWNLGLSLFSAWGVWSMSRVLAVATRSEGFFFTVCADTTSLMTYSGDSPAALALALFCLSKVPELGDTVFLILKRKPVRLLQWYHHASVMLFCWLALATEYTPGLWFAATNYFVHSIMYMYFFLMTFKSASHVVKRIAPFVTIIQILQMVWGLVVNSVAVSAYFRTGTCQIQAMTVYCAVAMYASYFSLFAQLFLESRRAARRSGLCVVRSLSRKLSQQLAQESDEDDKAADKKVN
mmetsp:Transcript_25251/g.72694  ORF Transcript_25251/g.72694 Transcript_25251/m.72694 type:complete len:310 (+) Transcript_25251:69-998(+)